MSLSFRSAVTVCVLLGAAHVEAASVKNLVVKCIHREEVSNDDIYLAAVSDGKPVSWSADNQKGTSAGNTMGMKEDSVLALDVLSLSGLKFNDTLQIAVKEKNLTSDETIGTVTIKPGDGTKMQTFKTKNYEYKVEYIVE